MRFSFVLLALLLCPLSFAVPADFLDSFPIILGGVIFVMIVMLALLFMLAESLNSQQLTVWVKSELREMVIAAILFAIVYALFNGSTSTVQILTGIPNYQEAAGTFLTNMVARATSAYDHLIKAYYLTTLRGGFQSSITAGVIYIALSFSGASQSGYGALTVFLSQASNALAGTIILYEALNVLLRFFLTSVPRLLYLAFVLRFIPFTRQLGSTLIALLIGAYILFPLSLVLLNEFHNLGAYDPNTYKLNVPNPTLSDSDYSTMGFLLPPGISFICGETWMRTLVANYGEFGFALIPCLLYAVIASIGPQFAAVFIPNFMACWEILAGKVYPLLMNVLLPLIWLAMMLNATIGDANVGAAFMALKPFLADINNFVLISYIDVILVAIIVITGVRSLSTALGGEYMLPGIQRLIQ